MTAQQEGSHFTDALDDEINKLKNLATQLNSATDYVHCYLEELEARLQETKVNVEVWLDDWDAAVLPQEFGEDHIGHQIGWIRSGGAWCLAIRPARYAEGFVDITAVSHDDDETTFLLKAPRILRFEAVKQCPKLVAKLIGEAERHLAHVDIRALMAAPGGANDGR